jgi:uncharacterized protein
MGVCAGVQVVAGRFLGAWAWVPTMLVFWTLIALFLRAFSAHRATTSRFGLARGSVIWSLLAVGVGLLALPAFLRHWPLLNQWQLVLSWLVFALVNPWFEESYWRGLIIDSTAAWGRTASLLYSTVIFAISHPLIWGIHSVAMRDPKALIGLVIVGLVWGLAYQRTGTLRWCVAGHMLANLFGLATLSLLNLYDPILR